MASASAPNMNMSISLVSSFFGAFQLRQAAERLGHACRSGDLEGIETLLRTHPNLDLNSASLPLDAFAFAQPGTLYTENFNVFDHETVSGSLAIAVGAGQVGVVEHLLSHHLPELDFRLEVSARLNVVEFACFMEDLPMVRMLARWHAQFDWDRQQIKTYQNPIEHALLTGNKELLSILLEQVPSLAADCSLMPRHIRSITRMTVGCVRDAIQMLMDHPRVLLDCGKRPECQDRHCQDLLWSLTDELSGLVRNHPRFPGLYPGCFVHEFNMDPLGGALEMGNSDLLAAMLAHPGFTRRSPFCLELEKCFVRARPVDLHHFLTHPVVGHWFRSNTLARVQQLASYREENDCDLLIEFVLATPIVFKGPITTTSTTHQELLERYIQAPLQVASGLRHKWQLPHPAALLYCNLWAWNNDLLREQKPGQNWRRVLGIYRRLPTELRMVLSARLAGYACSFIAQLDVATAIKTLCK